MKNLGKIELTEKDKKEIIPRSYLVSLEDMKTVENYFPKGTKFYIGNVKHKKDKYGNGYSYTHKAFVDEELIIELNHLGKELHYSYNPDNFWKSFKKLDYNIKRFSLFGYCIDIYKIKL